MEGEKLNNVRSNQVLGCGKIYPYKEWRRGKLSQFLNPPITIGYSELIRTFRSCTLTVNPSEGIKQAIHFLTFPRRKKMKIIMFANDYFMVTFF